MKIDGACHCGFITYEAEANPANAGICHCTDCQGLTGSAFRATVRSEPGTLKLLSGTPTVYTKKTAESGTPRLHAFCPRCGSPIYATSTDPNPQSYSLRLGNIRQRAELIPKKQTWTRSRLAWVDALASIPASDRG